MNNVLVDSHDSFPRWSKKSMTQILENDRWWLSKATTTENVINSTEMSKHIS